jgi:hypothetical protein
VVSVYEGYAIVVPITTADVAGDRDQYHALVSAGGSAQWWMRLPALEGAWTADAVALLFLPQTLDEEALADKRMASMHPTARSEVVGEIRLGLRLVTSGCVSVPGPASIRRTTAEDLVGVLAVR